MAPGHARSDDTLVYSPLATLFGVLRGVGTSTARNRFDQVLSARSFEVLDALLEQIAQETADATHASSAVSVTQLNLGSLRAVILMVRLHAAPAAAARAPPRSAVTCRPPHARLRLQVAHKLIRRGVPADIPSRYFRCYQEAERQFQASRIPVVRCAALDVMVRACIVDAETGAASKGKLVTLMKQVLRAAAVKANPVFKLMEVLLKGLIDLCEAFPEIISTAMSTLVNMLIDDVRGGGRVGVGRGRLPLGVAGGCRGILSV